MSSTLTLPTGRIVVAADAPREQWQAERGEGVTASQAWEIARGTLKTWRRIAADKMNGSSFRGTAATRAGHAREDALLDEAAELLADCTPNRALWGAADNDAHRATPDGTGHDHDGRLVVVEVKSHEHGWKHDTIPLDHLGQIQWQIRVLGADAGLYGFEVRDEDDQPPLDGATWLDVPRDDEMIAWLIERADQFNAWREAGCPDFDEMPKAVAKANAKWGRLKRRLDAATIAEKAASEALKTAIADHYPHARRFGAVAMGAAGGFQLIPGETVSIDESAWKDAEPEAHARIEEMRVALAVAEATAKRKYPKTTRRAPQLRLQEVENV